jgi:ketosteroid isomerase-like protein
VTESQERVVQRFVAAANAYDFDALARVLADDVVIAGFKGTFHGHDEARRWLGAKGTNLYAENVVDKLRSEGDRVLAIGRRRWHWSESGELADEQAIQAVFWLRDGQVVRWQPFLELERAEAALAGADLDTGT